MAWVLDDLVPGLDDRATDGVAFDARPGHRHTPGVEIYLDAPDNRHLSELLADGEHAVQARHPATMYSRASVVSVISNRIRAGGICDQGTKSNRVRQIPPAGIYA